jgi:hypothetical protein
MIEVKPSKCRTWEMFSLLWFDCVISARLMLGLVGLSQVYYVVSLYMQHGSQLKLFYFFFVSANLSKQYIVLSSQL